MSLVLILLFFSHQRNHVWKNDYLLWYDTVRKSQNKISPHINLGNAYIRRGAWGKAEKEFLSALSIDRNDMRGYSGLGVVYYEMGRVDEAIDVYRRITESVPDFPPGHNNLGVALMAKGLLDEAIREFRRTMQLDKNFSDAYANLGFAYKKKGMLIEAKQELEKALELNPQHYNARRQLRELK